MVKNSSSQNGSIFAVITIILVVTIVGALGFVLWQRLSTEKSIAPSATSETKLVTQEQKPNMTQVYSNETYSFSYPSEKWVFNEPSEKTGQYPSVSSEDFTAEPFTIKTGAIIYINQLPSVEGQEFEQRMNTEFYASTVTDIKKISVDGIDAHSYTLGYEGIYNITEFIKDGMTYQIRYQVADGEKSQYDDVYKLLVDSFKFK